MSVRRDNELNRKRVIRLKETGYDGIEPTEPEYFEEDWDCIGDCDKCKDWKCNR
ncbi:MAG: hypothetical protein ACFFC7_34200 [Candidatus Hermodarchaeota archaeon]